MIDLSSYNHFGPIMSSLLVDGFATFGFGAIIALALFHRARQLREARAAEASADVNPILAPGPAVVFGQVEYAQGAPSAVRVEVDQDGEEIEGSSSWSHKWTEKNRHVSVNPFYLRIKSDKRIRIEPTGDVFLVDDMDGLIRVDLTKRKRFAELTPGERVYASGELVRAHDPEATMEGGGYRSFRDSLVLRPLRGEPMLLSSKPLGARFHARVSFYTKAAVLIAMAALAFHLVFSGFHIRRFLGQTTLATVTKLDHYITRSIDGDNIDNYRVWLSFPSGSSLSDHVNQDTFSELHVQDVVPMRVVPGTLSDRSTIGPDVTAPISAFAVVPLLLVCWFFYKHREKTSQAWYDRDVIDTGTGRLEETLAKEQSRSSARS